MKKTIVEVIPSLNKRAGAEVFLVSLMEQFLKFGFCVHLIVLYDDGIDPSFNKILHRVNLTILNKKKGLDLRCSKAFKKALDIIKPDILHMHLNCLTTFFFAYCFKKPTFESFLTVHSIASKDSTGIVSLLRLILSKRKMLKFIAINNAVFETIKEKMPKAETYTINNGIVLYENDTFIEKKYDLICVAAFRKEKNHVFLFDAIETMLNNNVSISVLCVGNGETFEQDYSYLRGLKCFNNFAFIPNTDDVYQFLTLSRIFTLTSLYEGCPISILEAMSCGLPILAPSVGGIGAVVKDNINGFLYTPNDTESYIFLLQKLLNDQNLINSIGLNNKKNIKDEYSIEKCAHKYSELFFKGGF